MTRVVSIGDKFNRLTVLSFSHFENKRRYWNCICICGNETVVRQDKLRDKRKQSCGCLQKENNAIASIERKLRRSKKLKPMPSPWCSTPGCTNEPVRRSSRCRICLSRYLTLKKRGVDEYWYETKLKEQNGVCAICKQPEKTKNARRPGKIQSLSIDHNHKTGQNRGLLCFRCNSALGILEENQEIIKSMLDYMVKHNGTRNQL